MVLEERLVFGDAGDADRFVTFLKGRGVRARRHVISCITEETLVRGSLAQLFDWVNAEIEDRKDDDDLSDQIEADLGEEEEDFADAMIRSERLRLERFRETLTRQYVVISTALEKKQVGDLVTVGRPFSAQDQPDAEQVDGELRNLLGELDELVARRTLIEQGILEETTGGLRLARMVVPDEIETELSVTDIDISPGLVQEHGVRTDFEIFYDTEYVVECEGSIHLSCRGDELEEAVLGRSVTPESLETLVYHLGVKGQAIGVVLEVFDREGRTSLETVVEAVRTTRLETNSPEATVVLNTPPEFVRALVDDLRKAGAITGNDRKMRRA
ncbi:MAG: hypothetical protein AB7S61_07510 [Methanoregulaceae archaeon]